MRRAVLVVIAVAVAGVLLAAVVAADLLTRPATRLVGPAPVDLHAQTVSIPTTGDAFVKGWLVRGNPGAGAVLLLQGVRSDRRQMVDRARFLNQAGYTALLIDLPAHGESPGERITFGARESAGVLAALKYLRTTMPDERIGVIGVSLGAASMVLSHSCPAPDAVVLESMYPSITDATEDRIAIRLGPAGKLLAPLLLWQLPLRLGVDPKDLRPIDDINQLGAPVLIVSGARDQHTTPGETRRIFEAAAQPKALWEVPGAAHVDLHGYSPASYESTILSFLGKYLVRPRGPHGSALPPPQ